MKKVLIVYFSATGKTYTMADYIAEGVRFNGHQATVKEMRDIKETSDLEGYDGYIVGSPTFSLDIPGPMKHFIELIPKAKMAGKLSGAFGPYHHDAGYKHDTFAPAQIMNALRQEHGMKEFDLGALHLQDDIVETDEGMRTCQDYGRVFGEKLGQD
jgi:flavodoxin